MDDSQNHNPEFSESHSSDASEQPQFLGGGAFYEYDSTPETPNGESNGGPGDGLNGGLGDGPEGDSSASLNEDVFELIQEGVAVLDPDLSIRSANPAFRRCLHLEVGESGGLTLANHRLVQSRVQLGDVECTLAEALQRVLQSGVRLAAVDVDVHSLEGDSSERFTVQAKCRQSPPGTPSRILLWVRPVEAHAELTPPELSVVPTTPDVDVLASEDTAERADSLVHALNLVTNYTQLCVEVLDMALRISGGGSGSLMLLEENGRDLTIAASRGLSEPVVSRTRLQIGEGIAGKVAETGEALLLPGRVGDSRFRGTGGRPEILSSVCVPIKADQQVLGVLNVNSISTDLEFDVETRNRTAAYAAQLGAVLRHSRQFQSMQQRSTQLTIQAEIEAVAFSDDDLDAKLHSILSSIDRLLPVDTFLIYLVDQEKQILNLVASSGVQTGRKADLTVPFGLGVPGWVAQHGSDVVMSGSIAKKDRLVNLTTVGVPIRQNGELIGITVMESSSPAEEVGDLKEAAASISSAIARVIREGEVKDESKKRLTTLSALSEIGLAMTESPDPSSFAKLTAYCAVTLLENDIALVRLAPGSMSRQGLSPADLALEATHGISVPGEEHPLTALENQLIERVIASGEVKSDLDLPEDSAPMMLGNADVRSALCIPMMSGDALIGTITVFGVEQPANLGEREHEAEIGERLGDYAAAAARRFVQLAA